MKLVVWSMLALGCGAPQAGHPGQSTNDVDGDGVPDVVDKCAYEPGPDANSGCPVEGSIVDVETSGSDVPVDPTPVAPAPTPTTPAPAPAPAPPGPPPPPTGGPATTPPAPPAPPRVRSAADRDGDGVADDIDQCPDDPEDRDGFEDADGCPDPDNDRDGIADVNDLCPNEPEDLDGSQDDDGCPE